MNEIWIATSNAHKVQEFKRMFDKLNITVHSMLEMSDSVEIIENGSTFQENAAIKAETLCKVLNQPVIADDSGLVVDALGGEPGIHSARWMGYDTDYTTKNNEIIRLVQGADDRSCRFVCAIALAAPNEETKIFTGTIEGEVAHSIHGENGFGYDPIFYVPSLEKRLSEISEEDKNQISHRGKACRLLVEYLNETVNK